MEVIQIGNIVDTGNWDNPQRGRIYSVNGICPTLNTCGGGNLEPKILEIKEREIDIGNGNKEGWQCSPYGNKR